MRPNKVSDRFLRIVTGSEVTSPADTCTPAVKGTMRRPQPRIGNLDPVHGKITSTPIPMQARAYLDLSYKPSGLWELGSPALFLIIL